jgi:hypothetical protein
MKRLLTIAAILIWASVAWAAPTGEAHLVLRQQANNSWTCTFETLYVGGAGNADFNAAGLHAGSARATTAACLTWAKAVIGALDTGGNIPNVNKSYEAHSKHSTGGIED